MTKNNNKKKKLPKVKEPDSPTVPHYPPVYLFPVHNVIYTLVHLRIKQESIMI